MVWMAKAWASSHGWQSSWRDEDRQNSVDSYKALSTPQFIMSPEPSNFQTGSSMQSNSDAQIVERAAQACAHLKWSSNTTSN